MFCEWLSKKNKNNKLCCSEQWRFRWLKLIRQKKTRILHFFLFFFFGKIQELTSIQTWRIRHRCVSKFEEFLRTPKVGHIAVVLIRGDCVYHVNQQCCPGGNCLEIPCGDFLDLLLNHWQIQTKWKKIGAHWSSNTSSNEKYTSVIWPLICGNLLVISTKWYKLLWYLLLLHNFINTPKIVQQISTLTKDSDSNSALSSKQKRTKERLSATLFAVYAPWRKRRLYVLRSEKNFSFEKY